MTEEEMKKIKEEYPEQEVGRAQDIRGQKFHNWTVLYRTLSDKSKKVRWVCQCDCGTIKTLTSENVKVSHNCGCSRLQTIRKKADERVQRQYDNDGNLVAKKCPSCQQVKSIVEFWHDKAQIDGFCNICKQCQKETVAGRYSIYKKNAKKRSISFNLTKEQFNNLTKQNCFYCGMSPKENNQGNFMGVDRVDSSKGYEIDNCVPCCEVCNKMKLDYTADFFYQHIQRILNHQKELQENE